MAGCDVVIRDLRQMEITVRVSKIFWLRMWALKALLLLAAKVSRAEINFEGGE